jgi:osmotically-inducible protein OsmY
MKRRSIVLAATLLGAVAGGQLLTACAPLIVGTVGGAAMVAADRRSAGTVVDDQGIELKVRSAASRYSDLHLSVTSYNGVVLLSGEAPSQAVIDELVNYARTTPRVRKVENELIVAMPAGLGSRTDDTVITSKVKARMVEANKFAPIHVKVVTERSVVYLFGLVTQEEAQAATEIAASTSGVTRVVRLFEYV